MRFVCIGIPAISGCRQRQVAVDLLNNQYSGELQKLIASANDANRTRWWPAVNRLGVIAASHPEVREQIWNRAHVNTLGMKFVRIQPGRFTMGPDFHRLFEPQWPHSVTISQPYFMSVTEVTNAQYLQICADYKMDVRYSSDPDSPAVRIGWEDAAKFCDELSRREGHRYRLPTEAEWEYACRAGNAQWYCFGNDFNQLSEYAWWNNERGKAALVALLQPNAWGLYDMHGNVFEWVHDWYSDGYYAESRRQGNIIDPQGPPTGSVHVLRGGGWQVENPEALTSTARFPLPRFDRFPFDRGPGMRSTIGFRIVREAKGMGKREDESSF